MPTGSGKSAIYQVAGVMADGLCMVVSPLIALQADQCDGLNEIADRAPTRALAINSTLGARRQSAAWDDVEAGRVDFLFLPPSSSPSRRCSTCSGGSGRAFSRLTRPTAWL